MFVELLDYQNNRVATELPDDYMNRKARVIITVIYGDEVLSIDYGDGMIELDRADYAIFNDARGYDGSYCIYDVDEGVDLLNDPEWQARKDSYQFLW